ncbi:MAG TPA: hypothetical protein PKZ99_09895 [Azospirillaceae bacterium]|nr:hypothetical protein [Azospirillaceae bacterium]
MIQRNGVGYPYIVSEGDWKNQRAHQWFESRGRMPLWVVHNKNTMDYPGLFVARLWVTLPQAKPTRRVMTHPDLDGLRDMLPPGLACIARSPADDPVIIETWI